MERGVELGIVTVGAALLTIWVFLNRPPQRDRWGDTTDGGIAVRSSEIRAVDAGADRKTWPPAANAMGREEGADGEPPPPAFGRYTLEPYIVQAGDSIRRIAERFGIIRAELLASHRIDAQHPLVEGRILRIRRGVEGREKPAITKDERREPKRATNDEVVAPGGHGFYQIEKGDTVHSIAISFETNTGELRRLNELPGDTLHVGDFLLVPVPNESLYE
jgi:LysM repeat protein